jgi:transposase
MFENLLQPADSGTLASESGQFLSVSQRKQLLEKLQAPLRPEHRRRIEIMLLADMGHSQAQICEKLQCSHETARFWISMAQLGQIHHWDILPVGRPKVVNDQYLDRLKELVSGSPRDYGYFFRSWTAEWLSKHLEKEFDIKVSDRHINRLLKKMGLSTRPKDTDTEKANHSTVNESSGIVVCNLHCASPSQSMKLWPFSPQAK